MQMTGSWRQQGKAHKHLENCVFLKCKIVVFSHLNGDTITAHGSISSMKATQSKNTLLHLDSKCQLFSCSMDLVSKGADVSAKNADGKTFLDMEIGASRRFQRELESCPQSQITSTLRNNYKSLKNFITLGHDDLCFLLIRRLRFAENLTEPFHPMDIVHLFWEARNQLPVTFKYILDWEIAFHNKTELELQACCKKNVSSNYNLRLFQAILDELPKPLDAAYLLTKLASRLFIVHLLLNFLDFVTDLTLTVDFGLHGTEALEEFPIEYYNCSLSDNTRFPCSLTAIHPASPFIFTLAIFLFGSLAEFVIITSSKGGELYGCHISGICCPQSKMKRNKKAQSNIVDIVIKIYLSLLQPFATQIYEFYVQEFVGFWLSPHGKQGVKMEENRKDCFACRDCESPTCICIVCGRNALLNEETLVKLRNYSSFVRSLSKMVTANTENSLMPLLQMTFLLPYVLLKTSTWTDQDKQDPDFEDDLKESWRFGVTVASISLSVISMSVTLTDMYFAQLGKDQYKSLARWMIYFVSILPQVVSRLLAIQVFVLGDSLVNPEFLLGGFAVVVVAHYAIFFLLHLSWTLMKSRKSRTNLRITLAESALFSFSSLYTMTKFKLDTTDRVIYWETNAEQEVKDCEETFITERNFDCPGMESKTEQERCNVDILRLLFLYGAMLMETIFLISGISTDSLEDIGIQPWKVMATILGLQVLGLYVKSCYYLYLHPWVNLNRREIAFGITAKLIHMTLTALAIIALDVFLLYYLPTATSLWTAIMVGTLTVLLIAVSIFKGSNIYVQKSNSN